ncbi:MAG: GTP-binding protein [Planctomycetia bacterium]|nr:GTP-binding protein [Planctomycetia bacterium]
MLMEALADRGAQIVGWQDLMANAALECLSFAPTVRTATILLDQHRGAWRTAVRRIIAGLPDDQELRLLASRVPLGLHLTNPWKVTLAGAPNAGKSSLVNALAGYTRSIVAPTPGTTRDLVRVPVALDGWPVELIDTAGLRDSTEMIEATGIAQARREIESADLCVWVVDATAENPQWPGQTPKPTIIAINKVEAVPAWNISNVPGVCRVSAHTGAGVSELAARMIAALVPEVPEPGAAVPHTLEQGRAVLAALAYLEGGQVEEAREVLKRYSEE